MFENIDGRTDGRTPEWLVYYKLTMSIKTLYPFDLLYPLISLTKISKYHLKISPSYFFLLHLNMLQKKKTRCIMTYNFYTVSR